MELGGRLSYDFHYRFEVRSSQLAQTITSGRCPPFQPQLGSRWVWGIHGSDGWFSHCNHWYSKARQIASYILPLVLCFLCVCLHQVGVRSHRSIGPGTVYVHARDESLSTQLPMASSAPLFSRNIP